MYVPRSSPEEALRLSLEEAMELTFGALRKIGYTEEEAKIIGDHVVDNALCGYRMIAFPRILQMAELARKDSRREPLRVERLTPTSARVHGGNRLGHLTDYEATRVALEIAREHRFAVVGANDSVTSGRIAYYMEIVARAGFIGLQFTAASVERVAPYGAAAPLLGTNPIAFGIPADPDPVVFDMGTSATMGGDVMLAQRLGQLLPEGIAIDGEGKPTRDPNRIGAVLPFGGHKGYGLAFIAQALGILAGAPLWRDRVRDWGALFVVIDPELMMPLADFKGYLARLIAEIKALPRQEGVDEIFVPSERAYRERARRRIEGVEIDRKIYEQIRAL